MHRQILAPGIWRNLINTNMKNKHAAFILSIIAFAIIAVVAMGGCASTPAQTAQNQANLAKYNAFRAQAKPIADIAITVAAESQGVPPGTTAAALAAENNLYGMASAAWAGQPPAQGSALPDLASAVLPLLKGKNATTAASILTAAAMQAAPAK